MKTKAIETLVNPDEKRETSFSVTIHKNQQLSKNV